MALTIEPGVEVKFNSDLSLQVNGGLIARGTEASPIVFTSNEANPASGNWGFIQFTDFAVDAVYDVNGDYLSGSILEHCVVEYGNSIGDGAIWAISSSPFIGSCTFQNNSLTQLGSQIDHTANTLKFDPVGNTLKIINNSFNNNRVALDIQGSGSEIIIHSNTFDGNAYEAVELQAGNSTVVISNNIFKKGQGSSSALNLNKDGGSSQSVINFIGNEVSNNGRSMEIGNGTFNIDSNLFYSNTSWAIDSSEGTFLDGGVTISNNSFVNNTCFDNNNRGAGCGIRMKGPVNPTISTNKFHGNDAGSGNGVAIVLWRGATITSNTFSGNTGNSLLSRYQEWNDPARPIVSNNNMLSNNVSYDFYLQNDTIAGATATHNWWGTTSDSEIQALIYDWNDNATLAIVDYTPFLIQPNTGAPVSPPMNVAAVGDANALSIDISWGTNPESDVARYNVYYDTDESGFPYDGTGAAQGDSPIDVGNVIGFTLSGLTPWIAHHIAITAVDADGNESWYSQEQVVTLQPGVDTTPPYTAGHAPAKNAFGVPVDTDICLQVRDDDSGVDMASIGLSVDGLDVTAQSVITGTSANYTVCYDPPIDFGYGQVVDVTVDASDQAIPPNVMPTDSYSFTTFVPTCRGLAATHIGTNGPDILVGTPNDDVMVGLAGDDVILALGGNDVVCAGPGDDFVDGGLGNDRIFGEEGDDDLRGGPGRDKISGGPGNDHLRGGSGRDFLKGNAGDDVLDGGSRNDRIFGAGGDDVALGGFGDDTIACGANFDFANGGPGAGDTATPDCEVTTNIP